MFLGLRKLGNIYCGHKLFLILLRNILCPGHKICVRYKCCARANGETFVPATMCTQQCVLVCQGLKRCSIKLKDEEAEIKLTGSRLEEEVNVAEIEEG